MDERYLNNSYEEEYDEYDDENRYDDNYKKRRGWI